MLFKYDKYEKKIIRLNEVDFSLFKIMERQDMEKWVEEGYAEKYAEVYEEGIKFRAVYKKVMKNG